MRLIRITAPYFVAGIADGTAAPIIRYMREWTDEEIQAYCRKKGWRVEIEEVCDD